MGLRSLTAWLAVFLLVTGWAEVDRGASSTYSIAPGDRDGPAYVDATEILYLESFPVQVHLVVRGALPTPCHEAVWQIEELSDAISVRLWSKADPELPCTQVLEPFEVSIPLGWFESSHSQVRLNGEQIARLAIGPEPATDDVSLVGAGWSFGRCGGYCHADLAVEGEGLVLTGRRHMGAPPLYVNRGALTAVARERIDAAVARLEGVALDPVYGCPDCADGGAAYLMLARQGATSRHEMELGRPHEVLAELYGLAMAVIDALETCGSDELVAVADDCEPWQGR